MKKLHCIYIPIVSVLGVAVIVLAIILGIHLKSPKSYYENKVSAYAVENANYSKGQIVFIGDSITDLYHLNDYYNDLSLATYNRGIGGDTTIGVKKRLKTSLYDIAPSKIVLMIGVNDVDGGRKNADIVKTYNEILDDIKTNLPTTQVYVMSVISQNKKLSSIININKTIPQIMELNVSIKDMAKSHGYTYLDLFSLTADSNNHLIDEYTDDGIHLNANGFVVWTNLVKPYL